MGACAMSNAAVSGRGGARRIVSLPYLPPADCTPTHRSAPSSPRSPPQLAAMATVSVALAPSPGFCVKCVTLAASECSLTPPPPPAAGSAPERLVLPTSGTKKPIPKGTKVFVNIAYDANVPPPPEGSEDAIQRAMRGDELPDEDNAGGWFVPLVVPAPREDTDKGRSPSCTHIQPAPPTCVMAAGGHCARVPGVHSTLSRPAVRCPIEQLSDVTQPAGPRSCSTASSTRPSSRAR